MIDYKSNVEIRDSTNKQKYYAIYFKCGGFCDIMGKFNTIYIFMSIHHPDIQLVYTDKTLYKNYHSKSFDYYDKFDLGKKILYTNQTFEHIVNINLSEEQMIENDFIPSDKDFDLLIITPQLYWARKLYNHTTHPEFCFYNKFVKYNLLQNPFDDSDKCKVLFHLRRDDILTNPNYEKMIKPTIHKYISVLENHFNKKLEECDIVLCSDGIDKYIDKYKDDELKQESIKNFQNDFDFLDCKKFIGTDNYNTHIFYDAVVSADIMISNYSSVPRMFKQICSIKAILYGFYE